MNNDAEKMIAVLSPEIDKKCLEIRQTQKEKKQVKNFFLLCIAVIFIPTLFVFLEINLMILIIPVIFIAVAFLIISPILLNHRGGHQYEQA